MMGVVRCVKRVKFAQNVMKELVMRNQSSSSAMCHVKVDAGTLQDVREKVSPVPHSENGWSVEHQMIYHEFLIATSREGAWYG
ncbi:MAG TPA: hypothetical protein DEP04_04215 [Dehalococcoidia bacterium]|nr:hypothetical protein [Dehalococcoidia bacterium]